MTTETKVVPIAPKSAAAGKISPSQNFSAFLAAVRDGKYEVVERCLQTYPVDLEGESLHDSKMSWVKLTPLMWAALWGDLRLTNLLLRHGAKLHTTNSYRYTALTFAAENGHVDVCNRLLQLGADVRRKDKYNNLDVHYAARGEATVETVRCLVAHGASISERDAENLSLVEYAGFDPRVRTAVLAGLRDVESRRASLHRLLARLFRRLPDDVTYALAACLLPPAQVVPPALLLPPPATGAAVAVAVAAGGQQQQQQAAVVAAQA